MKAFKTISGLLLLTVCFTFLTSAQMKSDIDGLKWHTWNEGYPLAKETGKIVLVDMYTDWCGWCKRMDKDTYAKNEIINLINEHFVPIKFNPEKTGITYEVEGNKVNGRQLMGMLANGQRIGYPSTVFIYTDSKKLYLVSGYQNADQSRCEKPNRKKKIYKS